MKKVYVIKDYRDGYYSAAENRFAGILFATKYDSLEEAEMILETLLFGGQIKGNTGFIFPAYTK